MLPLLAAAALFPAGPTLVGFARLPADTFEDGPTSGQFISTANGRIPPFVLRQPVQGVSAILRAPGDRFLALTDNGFGAKGNSADHVLRYRSLAVDFRRANGGSGRIRVVRTWDLSDPYRKVAWPLVADAEAYPSSAFPVDATVRESRLLTGADFDPESFRQASDGSLWFGDEFGPFLLNTDLAGRLLRPPVPIPEAFAPENPLRSGEPNLRGSRGIEGMASSADGRTLYPLLEGPLTGESELRIYEFDTRTRRFSNRQWRYRLDRGDHSIGDMTRLDGLRMLVIERDGLQGLDAKFKKVFLVDLEKGTKTEVLDLLNIDDPDDLDRDQHRLFRFPHQTIESVAVKDAQTLVLVNDNNYPFSSARVPSVPDDTEFIEVRLPKPLR